MFPFCLFTKSLRQVDSTPPARISVARLLAHYAASLAACSAGRTAVITSAQAAATGGGREGSDDESSSDSNEEEETGDGHDNKNNNTALSRHLSALCAANLAGSEPGTLEFVRCVGDAVFATDGCGGDVPLASPLAPSCGRALARLRRPAASPAPTAAQFLRRAYAFRVVEALKRSARSTSLSSKPISPSRQGAIAPAAIAGRGSGGATSGGGGGAAAAWDFVGDSSAPPALLEFLGRPEAPVAVGQGGAAQPALKELASRRNSPAAVAELLRSSPACAPAALGPLLSAMERLQGGEEGGGKTAAAVAVGVGGFFVDTGGAAGGPESVVLARLGSGDGAAVDMDEEEAASVASSAVSDSDGNE